MMKTKLFSLLALMLMSLGLKAQFTLTNISAIQVPAVPGTCNDSSVLYGDSVRIRGVVVVDGGLAQAAGGRNIWIQQNGGGANNGIDVFGFTATATTPDDILDLVAGDSVEIDGYVDEFSGETEIRPLSVTLKGSGLPVNSTVVNIGDLNDANQNNNITTGEQWEGAFVELQNVTVTVITYFSGNTRVSFQVQDGNGNAINVSDRFLAGRMSQYFAGGTLVVPTVGDVYCSLKGVLMHSKNNCPGANGRGYELHPFDASHYVVCSAAPSITNLGRNDVAVPCNAAQTITVDVSDADGVNGVMLHYAFGAPTAVYDSVAMTNTVGNTWSASIPGQGDGTFTKYYISATDNNGNYGAQPAVPAGQDPKFFTFRCNGLQIYDVQYVPTTFNSPTSGYVDMDVTVTGVVTASAEPDNLGYVFIQQENQLAWAGLMVTGNASLATLSVGDKVTVTGTVKEYFGYTRLENVSQVSLAGSGTITPLVLGPGTFTTWDFATNEQFEGMLVKLAGTGGNIWVVDANADDPSNFAEYRVGSDQFDPNTGCRVIAGRQTNSAFSSLNVSFVNDSSWATTDGIMNVPVCLVYDGMVFDSLTGVMNYSFGNFKILPRNNADFVGDTSCIAEAARPQLSFFRVYPNPANESVIVEADGNSVGSDLTLSLFDIAGRKVAGSFINQGMNRNRIEVSHLAPGPYFLSATDEDGNLLDTRKIIITR